MKKRLFCVMAALLLCLFSGCNRAQSWSFGTANVTAKGERADASVFAMDTYMSITVYSPDAFELAKYASERIFELEAIFDYGSADSEVSKINKAGELVIGHELASQIETAALVKERSGGALDITVGALVDLWGFGKEPKVPSEDEIVSARALCGDVEISNGTARLPAGAKLNLGATAKGYTSNELAQQFKTAGVESALISLGGNVQVVGSKPDGSAWRVGVQDPNDEEQNIGILSVTDCAVVTSGDYQRYFIEDGIKYCHVIDPRTGYSVQNGVSAVTVMCEDGLMADCLSTAMMVLGKDAALEYWSQYGGFEMLIVTDDGVITLTEGFQAVFEVAENLPYTVEVYDR